MITHALLLLAALTFPQDKPVPGSQQPPAQAPAVDAQWKVRVPVQPNTSCPIMGKPISLKLFTDTARGRIWICCKSCIKDIQADVELAYKTAYPSTKKLENKVCPLTGKPITERSVRVELQCLEFSVVDAVAAKAVADDAQAAIAKLMEPVLIDVDNRTCPISGEPVGKNSVVLVGKHLIRLSSSKALEALEADPRRALEKAQQIRAAQDAQSKPPAPAKQGK